MTLTETLPDVDHLDFTVDAVPCAVVSWGWLCEEEATWRVDATCDSCGQRRALVCQGCLHEVARWIADPTRSVGCTDPRCRASGCSEIVELVRVVQL